MKRTLSTLLIALLLMSSATAVAYADDTPVFSEDITADHTTTKDNNPDVKADTSVTATEDPAQGTASEDSAQGTPSDPSAGEGAGECAGEASGDDSGEGTGGDSGEGTGGDSGEGTGGDSGESAGGDSGESAGGDSGEGTGGDSGEGTGGDSGEGTDTPTPQPDKPLYVNKFVKKGGYTYYYGSDGNPVKNKLRKLNGNYYYFNSSGHMLTSKWTTWKGNKYYFQSSGKAYKTCTRKIGKYTYRFNKYARMCKNSWYKNSEGSRYYFNKYGHRLYGKQTIGGKKYYFNTSGKLIASNSMDVKAQGYSSHTGYLILVNTHTNVTRIYTGSKGNWHRSKNWSCTTGKSSTPTVKGDFTIGSRGTSFGSGYTCWYWTQFKSDYLFHSVIYNPGSKTSVQDGRLGKNLSHGCVRLSLSNAKWIYKHIPRKTRTIVY